MKDPIEYTPSLPLIEVKEIFADTWRQELEESINRKSRDTFYDDSAKIKIDVWDIK